MGCVCDRNGRNSIANSSTRAKDSKITFDSFAKKETRGSLHCGKRHILTYLTCSNRDAIFALTQFRLINSLHRVENVDFIRILAEVVCRVVYVIKLILEEI